ncbi:MAG: sensor histidine kinase [Halodesulfurarchaeum sp.]
MAPCEPPVEVPEKDLWRAAVDNFPNGVLVLFDTDLRYRLVGPEVLPFSKRRAADMVGKTIYELFPEETAAELETELRATLDGSSRSFDVTFDGRIHHLETQPVDIRGTSYGVLVTQEVSEERHTTEQLARQKARLESFAGVLSHDLRNPLGVAQGNLELEQEERGDSEHLRRAIEALERIDHIIDDLLTAAREGAAVRETEAVSLGRIARDAWGMVETGDATLRVETDGRLEADPSRLQRILENLFRNAVEHAGSGVSVTVGQTADGFFVEDDGPGIPLERREDIFDAGMSTSESGRGFGLFIVQNLAEAHDWSVRCTEATSGGARFEFDTGPGV